MQFKTIFKNLFFGILIISSSNLFGMETENNNSSKEHLESVLIHGLGATAAAGISCLAFYLRNHSLNALHEMNIKPWQFLSLDGIMNYSYSQEMANACTYISIVAGLATLAEVAYVIKHGSLAAYYGIKNSKKL